MSRSGAITDVAGVEVGHTTYRERGSGCTVVLCRDGAVGGVDVRGSAPGTRETDLLRPTNHVSEVHAVVLSGGSAFGLDSASGVVRFLAERDIGYREAGPVTVPIGSGCRLAAEVHPLSGGSAFGLDPAWALAERDTYRAGCPSDRARTTLGTRACLPNAS